MKDRTFRKIVATLPRSAVRFALFALLLTAVLAHAGPSTTLGEMRFEAPDAGWAATPSDAGMLYQKRFAPEEESRRPGGAIIQIYGPIAGGVDRLDPSFEAVANSVDDLVEDDAWAHADGETINGHRIRTEIRCCAMMNGLAVGQRTVGIASAGRHVVLALTTLNLGDDASDSADAAFAALVRSVALEADDKPFALEPQKGDGGLDGVYTHLRTGILPNPFGGISFYSNSEITMFDPSGLYSNELPRGDIGTHCRETPTDCGLYALKEGGRQIEMSEVADDFGTIKTETEPFAKIDGGIEIDGDAHYAVPPLAAGTPLAGTWRYFFSTGGSNAFSSTTISREIVFTFKPDGTFHRDGWAGASGTNEMGGSTVGYATGANPDGATDGRYHIEGYRLELTFGDGRTEHLSIFSPDSESDELLVLNGANYLKQD